MSYPIESFHAGDRVRFRAWDDMVAEYGLAHGMIQVPYHFVVEMKPLCDTEATIRYIGYDGHVTLSDFENEELGRQFTYSIGMLEPVTPMTHNVAFSDNDFVNLLGSGS